GLFLMRLRYVLAAVVLAAVAASASAQVGVYVNPVFTRISNSTPDTGPFAFLGEGATARILQHHARAGNEVRRGRARYDGAQQQRVAERLFAGRKAGGNATGGWDP